MATIVGGPGSQTLTGSDTEGDSIWGAGGGDLLYGGTITGGGGDLLDGGTGSDRIYGGDGDDTLIGGSGGGNDTLYGGSGTDTADYSRNLTALSSLAGGSFTFVDNNTAVNVNLATSVASGLGTDSLFGIENVIGGGGADVITGDGNANLLIGGAGNDTIDGGSGNDTIEGGLGSDSLIGGAGTDTVTFANSATGVNANLGTGTATGEGTDTLSGFENLTGSAQNDTLTGDGLSNVIDGLGGSDLIYGLGGNDTLYGGDGADTVYGGIGNDSVDGGTGTDRIYGGSGNDSLAGGGDADTVFGGTGNDTIDAGTGSDLVYGGPDTGTTSTLPPASLQFNWTDYADEANLAGGVVQDTGGINVTVSYAPGFSGATFSAETTGNADGGERDREIYVAGGEPFNADSSAELFRPADGSGGTSSMARFDFAAVSGSGFSNEVENVQFRISDIDLSGFTDSVTVRAFDADGNEVPITITVGNPAFLSLSGNTVTAINTSVFPNDLDGSVLYQIAGPVTRIDVSYTDLNNAQQAIRISDIHFNTVALLDNDSILGGDGNDTLYGGIGLDTLLGGIGDDRIYGGLGDDSLEGGDGDDILVGGDGNDTINFGAGNDTVYGGAGNDLIDDVPLTSATGQNLIYGGTGNDTVFSGDSNDTIYGDEGNDLLRGEVNDDLVYGGLGEDSLFGGDGQDTLYGDEGNDGLDGEAGNDTLYGGDQNDTLYGSEGNDVLYGGTGNDRVFGGDDRDLISMVFTDASGNESVDGGSGVGTSSDNDTLRVDITGFGWTRIDLVYDPLNNENGTITFYAADLVTVLSVLTFTEIENLVIVCFTPGTRIMTVRGEVNVEDLRPGELVVTRDSGPQPLRWVGTRSLTREELGARPELQPVRISAMAFGQAGPERTMLVSPQHRLLFEGARAEMYFGESEVLVPAKHLVGKGEVTRVLPETGVTYVHILFDRHEIVLSDGIWTESFQPAERTLASLDQAARAEVLALFPELDAQGEAFGSARPSLKAHEAKVLFAD